MLVCIRHPKYQEGPPDVSCKTCCANYVSRIRAEGAAGSAPKESTKVLTQDAEESRIVRAQRSILKIRALMDELKLTSKEN